MDKKGEQMHQQEAEMVNFNQDEGGFVFTMGVHFGEALLTIARRYSGIEETIIEAVQNCLDMDDDAPEMSFLGSADNVEVICDLATRNIYIRGNGDGVTVERFKQKLSEIAKSQKKSGRLGRFGKGFVAPIGKCEEFTFTSYLEDEETYVTWIFNTSDLLKQEKSSVIPHKKRKGLARFTENIKRLSNNKRKKHHPGKEFVWWNTEVHIKKFDEDRVIGKININSLESLLLTAYGHFILEKEREAKRKTKITITVIGKDGKVESKELNMNWYKGKPLDEYVYKNKKGEPILTARLYLASVVDGKRKGVISVGEVKDFFRLSMKQFGMASRGLLDEDILKGLNSGTFNGDFLAHKAKIRDDRKGFERNDDMVDFCCAIEKWYEEIGFQHVEEAKEDQRFSRYSRLVNEILPIVENIMKNKFPELFDKIKLGTIGDGHKDDDDTKGETGGKRGGRGGSPSPRGVGTGPGKPRQKPKRDIPGDKPAITGESGTRKIVEHHSTGLKISFSEFSVSKDVYRFDLETGELEFNCLHDYWQRCERTDTTLREFQFAVICQVLALYSAPDYERCYLESPFSKMLEAQVINLTQSTRLREPVKKKKVVIVKKKKPSDDKKN